MTKKKEKPEKDPNKDTQEKSLECMSAAKLDSHLKKLHTHSNTLMSAMRAEMSKEFGVIKKGIELKMQDNIKVLKRIEKRIESWEESMLYIYHNIKKNQFLYAHYPDEWVKDYKDIKQGLKDENNSAQDGKKGSEKKK
jgi:nitrogen-specific signal transduction histidine kinase